MSNQRKPLLSIGIIFKNEIRCLERCMRSLQPLRKAIPCELVMADTGSDDGSREVAARYADILFDFPWINDFAAARNAVMDRCSGEWYFSIDADEWLDQDINQLVNYLRASDGQPNFWSVMLRNYSSEDLKSEYSDFLGVRIARMSTNIRYTGAIHERWLSINGLLGLGRTILHHDGYVGSLTTPEGKAKRERNMNLLRKQLAKEPENMLLLLQCVESSAGSWEYGSFLRQAIAGVEKRYPEWKFVGPAIMRYAISFARNNELLDEKEAWLELAHSLFPDSLFTTIDIAFTEFFNLVDDKKYDEAIQKGEGYLKALAEYRQGKSDASALLSSSLATVAPAREFGLRTQLSDVYLQKKRFEEAREVLEPLDVDQLNAQNAAAYLGALMNLHAQSGMDMSPKVAELWERVYTDPSPDIARQKALLTTAAMAFQRKRRQAEQEKGFQHTYTAFLSLRDRYEIGLAAAVLGMTDPDMICEKLSLIENWGKFPIQALAHALECDVFFPLPNKPLNMEEMDKLAIRLASDKMNFFPLVVRISKRTSNETAQQLAWRRGVIIAALRAFSWNSEEADVELGMSIARIFAQTEKAFLAVYYAPNMFHCDKLILLPPMHRFGWHCVRAFEALDSSDLAGYVRCLREGLSTCEDMKSMVEFLIQNTKELQTATSSHELQEIANKVRTMLSVYDPADPAVAAIKQSSVYQKVAYLIEGMDGGGLPS